MLFAGVTYWGLLAVYQRAEHLKYHYLARMEVQGGLTLSDVQELEERLVAAGADPETISVTGDILDEGTEPVSWPREVELHVSFVPRHFNNFAARVLLGGEPGEPVTVRVGGVAVSQYR